MEEVETDQEPIEHVLDAVVHVSAGLAFPVAFLVHALDHMHREIPEAEVDPGHKKEDVASDLYNEGRDINSELKYCCSQVCNVV